MKNIYMVINLSFHQENTFSTFLLIPNFITQYKIIIFFKAMHLTFLKLNSFNTFFFFKLFLSFLLVVVVENIFLNYYTCKKVVYV